MRYVIAVGILLALLAGCGGGGGGGGLITPPTPPGDMREAQPGDYWEYDVTGTLSAPGMGIPVTQVWGTVTITVLSSTETSPISGETCRISQAVLALTDGVEAHQFVYRNYFDIAHGAWAGTQYASDPISWVDDPASGHIEPGPDSIGVGDNYDSGTHRLTSGETRRVTWVVLEVVSVSTPLGAFSTYRVSETITANGGVNACTTWVYPPLGTVASNDMMTFDGVSLELQSRLRATNVPY